LGQAEVTDSEGNKVDLSDFVRPGDEAAPAAAEPAEDEAPAEAASVTTPSDDPAAVKF